MIVKVKRVQINHTHIARNGGLFAYLALWGNMWLMLYQAPLSRGEKAKLGLMHLLKTPYYWLIKPWGVLFSIKTNFKGTYTLENEQRVKDNVIKTKFFRCMFVPLFRWRNKPNAQDWQTILA